MELITADVLVWRADFQRRAKELYYPKFTVLHHAAVAFEACGSLDLQLLTGPMESCSDCLHDSLLLTLQSAALT